METIIRRRQVLKAYCGCLTRVTYIKWPAKFLFSLGLRRAPPLSEILTIAASDNPSVREKALTFFLDNLSLKYSDYDPNTYRDLAFVPAVRGSERSLAKPFEVRDYSCQFFSLSERCTTAICWPRMGSARFLCYRSVTSRRNCQQTEAYKTPPNLRTCNSFREVSARRRGNGTPVVRGFVRSW
jgi:Protein of unknown function (DUF3684)